jgi:hypothetical protein
VIPVPPKFRALLVAFSAACLLAFVPAAARADQYIVDHCQTPEPNPQPAAAFASITGQTANGCGGPGGGLYHQEGTASLPNSGDVRDIVLSIPADRPNIQIERVITTFSMPGAPPPQGMGGTNGFAQLHMLNGNGDLVYAASAAATPIRPTLDLALPPGDRTLTWRAFCGGSACTWFEQNILSVFGTRLYLNEAVPPALTVTGGTLAGAGTKSGQMSLGLDATDTDSGVRSVSVTIGGIPAGSVTFPCAFNDWSACPRDEKNQLLQVDTTKVPDGNGELVATVRDTANNALTRSLGNVTVSNGGPALPNGANPSRLAKFTARFTSTSRRSRTLRFGSTPTVKGTLVNENDQPIAGATVAILAQLRQSGAQPVQVATVTTGADGAFATKLASGPSRTFSFAYTAFSGDAKPASTATLRTNVRAVVSARISPRSVRAGKRLRLSGRLSLLPRRGVQVTIQARDGRKWRTVDSVRTTRTGSFSWPYRFKPSAAGHTFAFRARVASPIYPFAAGNSKTLLVRVR